MVNIDTQGDIIFVNKTVKNFKISCQTSDVGVPFGNMIVV